MHNLHITVGEAARRFGVATWRIRRVADELDADLPRAGQYRLIPSSMLPRISDRLVSRGWLPQKREAGRD